MRNRCCTHAGSAECQRVLGTGNVVEDEPAIAVSARLNSEVDNAGDHIGQRRAASIYNLTGNSLACL